ncbi:pleckstrin homology domain-containing family J member 1 isoform X1 [Petaurus breviceps papuanus]|uniref:pleckstrin homology domain-containing family J member 1 isoform X1 n=2 Tax=Petaurus breviceps papuanus TaxID=3040969 RepID=UPI0036D91262
MRYNEKELQALSRQPAEKAAEIGMRVPKKGSVVKRRLVKLVVNFLFYFRTDEAEPIGALLLEHCRIAKEEPSGFSISFIEEPDRKYYFECSSEEQCQEWIDALRRASYEFMRRSLIFYRNEIQKMTGKDPLEQYGISEEARFQLNTNQASQGKGVMERAGVRTHSDQRMLAPAQAHFALDFSLPIYLNV